MHSRRQLPLDFLAVGVTKTVDTIQELLFTNMAEMLLLKSKLDSLQFITASWLLLQLLVAFVVLVGGVKKPTSLLWHQHFVDCSAVVAQSSASDEICSAAPVAVRTCLETLRRAQESLLSDRTGSPTTVSFMWWMNCCSWNDPPSLGIESYVRSMIPDTSVFDDSDNHHHIPEARTRLGYGQLLSDCGVNGYPHHAAICPCMY